MTASRTAPPRVSPPAPRRVLLALFMLPLMALSSGRVAAPLADAAVTVAQPPGTPPPSLQAGQPGLALT